MKAYLAAAFCLMASPALADCEAIAWNDKDQPILYKCDTPTAPRASVKCNHLKGVLICDGEIGQEKERTDLVRPENCGYRKGKYVCW